MLFSNVHFSCTSIPGRAESVARNLQGGPRSAVSRGEPDSIYFPPATSTFMSSCEAGQSREHGRAQLATADLLVWVSVSLLQSSMTVAWVEQQDVQGHPPFMPKLEQHDSNAAESQSIN